MPGCGASTALEIDHLTEWQHSFRTTLDQLAWLCRRHHGAKTHRGWRLEGPPGTRRWVPPGEGRASPEVPGPESPGEAGQRVPALFDGPSAA